MLFRSVMRKMVPNANGTTLTTELPAGESKTFNFTIPIPSYIYDYTQLGVVSFVQMKTSKEILQARESLVPIGAWRGSKLNHLFYKSNV